MRKYSAILLLAKHHVLVALPVDLAVFPGREVLLNNADELMNYTKSEEQQMEDFVKELVDAKVTPRCLCVPVKEGVKTALGIVCM